MRFRHACAARCNARATAAGSPSSAAAAVVGGSDERETEIVIEPGALRVLVPA